MHANFINSQEPANCRCASGVFPLAYAGLATTPIVANHWIGTGDFGCGHQITIDFYCNQQTSVIKYSYPDGCGVNGITSGNTGAFCDPFSDTFTIGTGVSSCGTCFGNFSVTITL